MSCNDYTINPHSSQLQENRLWACNRIVILQPHTHKCVMFRSNLNNHPINSVLNVSTLSTIISGTSSDITEVPNIYFLEQRTPLPTQLSSFRTVVLNSSGFILGDKPSHSMSGYLSVGTNCLNCFTTKYIYSRTYAHTHTHNNEEHYLLGYNAV
jgi:hypothetical protein